MPPLCQLAEPGRYRACDWDLKADAAGRAYWLGLFRWHLDAVLAPLIRAEYAPNDARLFAFRSDYLAAFDAVEQRPESFPRIDVLLFTEIREVALQQHGFPDPFRGVKQRENEAALALLPGVLAELDAAPLRERADLLWRGLLAGNIFDLGSRATIERHLAGLTAFHTTRSGLPPRPWLCDDAAAAWDAWQRRPPRHVVFFADNAGSDIVLGCLPLVRDLAQRGTRLTLATNRGPALNDITADELGPVLRRAAELDRPLASALATQTIVVRATGAATPLIDLARLDAEFAAAVADADLVWLHGMGRAIESNFHARFTCPAVWTAVLKDAEIAARIGGRLYDGVVRYEHP